MRLSIFQTRKPLRMRRNERCPSTLLAFLGDRWATEYETCLRSFTTKEGPPTDAFVPLTVWDDTSLQDLWTRLLEHPDAERRLLSSLQAKSAEAENPADPQPQSPTVSLQNCTVHLCSPFYNMHGAVALRKIGYFTPAGYRPPGKSATAAATTNGPTVPTPAPLIPEIADLDAVTPGSFHTAAGFAGGGVRGGVARKRGREEGSGILPAPPADVHGATRFFHRRSRLIDINWCPGDPLIVYLVADVGSASAAAPPKYDEAVGSVS